MKMYLNIIFFIFLCSCGKSFDSSLVGDISEHVASNSSIDRTIGDPSNGGVLYSMHCASCHNSDGSGIGQLGDSIYGPNIQGSNDSDILNAVEMGYGDMQPFPAEVLSIDDIEDIASIFDSFL